MQTNDRTAAHAAEDGVRPMRELPEFKVAEGDPDVRGWPVQTPDGMEIGRVNDLMVDTAAHRVAYLAVTRTRGERLLVPVEQMTADAARQAVVVESLESEANNGNAVDANAAMNAKVQVSEDEIRIPVVEEEIVMVKRPVIKEELVVKKSSVTREQTVEADLRKERVEVTRTDRNTNPGQRGS